MNQRQALERAEEQHVLLDELGFIRMDYALEYELTLDYEEVDYESM